MLLYSMGVAVSMFEHAITVDFYCFAAVTTGVASLTGVRRSASKTFTPENVRLCYVTAPWSVCQARERVHETGKHCCGIGILPRRRAGAEGVRESAQERGSVREDCKLLSDLSMTFRILHTEHIREIQSRPSTSQIRTQINLTDIRLHTHAWRRIYCTRGGVDIFHISHLLNTRVRAAQHNDRCVLWTVIDATGVNEVQAPPHGTTP